MAKKTSKLGFLLQLVGSLILLALVFNPLFSYLSAGSGWNLAGSVWYSLFIAVAMLSAVMLFIVNIIESAGFMGKSMMGYSTKIAVVAGVTVLMFSLNSPELLVTGILGFVLAFLGGVFKNQ